MSESLFALIILMRRSVQIRPTRSVYNWG